MYVTIHRVLFFMTPVHIIRATDQSSPNGAQPRLQAGSVVSARVLSAAGAGQYVISVAGQKVAVRSETPLQTGAVFSAKIGVRGEQVILSLVGAQGEAKPLVTQFTAGAVQNGMDAPLAHLLASLGLPATAESFGLLQFAQAMGVKIDARQLRKALAAAQKSGGGEEAAQTALLLDEKGLDASVDALTAILGGMSDGNGGREQRHQREKENADATDSADAADADQNEKTSVVSPSSVLSSLVEPPTLSDVKAYFDSVDSAATSNDVGALTLFNSFRGGAGAQDMARWVVLPFTWADDFCGTIRLLPDSDPKKTRQIIINAKNPRTSYDFVVYCNEGKVVSVRFSFEPELDAEQAQTVAAELKTLLLPSFGSLKTVSYGAALHGFCAQDTAIGTVGGVV